MTKTRPYVISIAGFDPSAGAGVLADIKTLEANKVYGFGVASALTYQNDTEFERVEWVDLSKIREQITLLKRRFDFGYVKIGLIENFDVLHHLLDFLHALRTGVKVIWDPVLKASAGYEFHSKADMQKLEEICSKVYLITPNIPEAEVMGSSNDAKINVRHLSSSTNVFLKGGHAQGKEAGRDFLFTKEGKEFSFRPAVQEVFAKHGSGCVLSSAVTAALAKGYSLHRSCMIGRQYTATFLSSHTSLLGYHKI